MNRKILDAYGINSKEYLDSLDELEKSSLDTLNRTKKIEISEKAMLEMLSHIDQGIDTSISVHDSNNVQIGNNNSKSKDFWSDFKSNLDDGEV